MKSSATKHLKIVKSLRLKLTGKSYLLPLCDYTMKDHSVGTQYRGILHGVNIEILKCSVI